MGPRASTFWHSVVRWMKTSSARYQCRAGMCPLELCTAVRFNGTASTSHSNGKTTGPARISYSRAVAAQASFGLARLCGILLAFCHQGLRSGSLTKDFICSFPPLHRCMVITSSRAILMTIEQTQRIWNFKPEAETPVTVTCCT